MATTHRCSQCGEYKTDEKFYFRSRRGRIERYSWCKPCTRANDRLRKYGVTKEQWNELYAKQDGRCAICRTSMPGGMGDFAVDHDHRTGKVRGLLCTNCNPIIGFAKENIDTLLAAVAYLTNQRQPGERK